MKLTNVIAAGLLLIFSSVTMIAQLTPAEAVLDMGRGINLGNTLEPPTEGGWNNPKAEEKYFDAYVDAGFKTIRIPVTWDKHVSTSSPYEVNDTWMDRVEEVVDWGLDRGLYVILNAHHEGWLKENYPVQATQDRFDSIWSQVAERFQGKTEKLFFEMINEPRTHTHDGLTQAEIDGLNERILGIIRKTNPTRIVVYSGKGWSSSSDMRAAAIPDDPYLMAYYHSYDPWSFAGEGSGSWGSASDKASLESAFNTVQNWSDANGIPVLLGEFGAIHECEYNSRMRHYAAYVEGAVKRNIIFAAWDDGGDFRILKRSSNTWDEMKEILINVRPESPTDLDVVVHNDSSLLLSWTLRSDDHDTLYIERRVEDGEFLPYVGVDPDALSYVDTLVEPNNYYYYRIIASYDSGDSLYSCPFRIYKLPTERFTYNDEPFSIPGTIEAEEYDIGGEGLTYHDETDENEGEAFRLDEAVDIEARTEGGYQLSYVEEGEWLEYTVNVAQAGEYKMTVPVASLDGGGSFRYAFDSYIRKTVTVPKTDSWQTTEDVIAKFDLREGEQVFRLEIISLPSFNIDKFIFEDATGVKLDEEEGFEVFPNPVSDYLYLQAEGDLLGASAAIYSSNGAKVRFIKDISHSDGIYVEDLEEGLYVIQLNLNKKQVIRRFIKR